MSPAPIDIVIPHVDGAAPGYEALCRQHTGDWVPCHLRDLGELRYVLRALAEHAPWARIILVVQSRGHLPAWLAERSVRVVVHEDFIPTAHLPTFHWASIVSHFHLIPGLSERYIIWEDDVVLGGRLDEDELFDAGGLPRTGASLFPILPGLERISAFGTYQRNLAHSRALLHRAAGQRSATAERPACFVYPHIPLPVQRTSWAALFDALIADPVYRDTVTRRSRGDERARPTVDPGVVYANWIEHAARGSGSARRYLTCLHQLLMRARQRLPGAETPPQFGKYAVVNDETTMQRHMQRLVTERPRYINVNDEAYDAWSGDPTGQALNPRSVRALHETLGQLYPRPSRHERVVTATAPTSPEPFPDHGPP